MKFPYALAAYPIKWKKSVISPKKICIQFDDIQCKTRAPFSKDGLKKTSKGTWEMPIDTKGTDIQTLAVGIPLHLYPVVLEEILLSLRKHSELYPENSIITEIQEIIDGFKSSNL